MNHSLLLCLLLTGCSLLPNTGYGQTERIVLGITPFSYAGYAESKYVREINEVVTNDFVRFNRFVIVDRSKLGNLTDERELQKGEAFIDSKVIEQGRSLGARYLVTGHVASIATTNRFSPESRQYVYQASVIVPIKVIDVETGQVLHAETFGKTSTGGSAIGSFKEAFRAAFSSSCAVGGVGPSSDVAIKDALANMSCAVGQWLRTVFPVQVSIVEVQQTHKRRGAEIVLLAAGKNYGLTRGKRLKVIELTSVTVDGKTLQRQKEIGFLEVKKVEDDNFSICSVEEGGPEIAEKVGKEPGLKVIIQ